MFPFVFWLADIQLPLVSAISSPDSGGFQCKQQVSFTEFSHLWCCDAMAANLERILSRRAFADELRSRVKGENLG